MESSFKEIDETQANGLNRIGLYPFGITDATGFELSKDQAQIIDSNIELNLKTFKLIDLGLKKISLL
jgi:hypothetical protein